MREYFMWSTPDSVISADGTRIVFQALGDGPPLVVMHGAPVTVETYYPMAELLATDYRVVVVCRRGYTPSGSGTQPRIFARQVEDLAAVLERQDDVSFVFGHSAGGLVVLEPLVAAGVSSIRRFALYEAPLALAGGPLRPTLERAREFVADHPADSVVEFFRAVLDSPVPEGILRSMGAAMADRAPGLIADLECLSAMDPDLNRWSATGIPALLLAAPPAIGMGRKAWRNSMRRIHDSGRWPGRPTIPTTSRRLRLSCVNSFTERSRSPASRQVGRRGTVRIGLGENSCE
ncbi:alpha/beta fold hydrolase [Nocardia sp. CC227C]|uniref:alpha/beta fold hydrolase n=1 Tax=Nocardia sp. CC227C TaxID=3044562 RepID=UPI00278C224C|nr:alpha/beta hydrolase [Nocardia sp. CC227C]